MNKKTLDCQKIDYLNFFKFYSKCSWIECKVDKSTSSNGVKKHFIFNLIPTNMYNRLSKNLGNNLKWYNFSRKDIIRSFR